MVCFGSVNDQPISNNTDVFLSINYINIFIYNIICIMNFIPVILCGGSGSDYFHFQEIHFLNNL